MRATLLGSCGPRRIFGIVSRGHALSASGSSTERSRLQARRASIEREHLDYHQTRLFVDCVTEVPLVLAVGKATITAFVCEVVADGTSCGLLL